MTLFEDLEYRGLIKDITSIELKEKLNAGGLTFYIGTDPTADSMHIGHLSSFLISKRLKDAGHNPILLIGGATGLIGDPRPTSERSIISKEEVNHNVTELTKQAKELFGFKVVNNYDWLKEINFIDFLRDYGKYFNINYMLDKDTIKTRLETGITYTEFSYMIMQAIDFLHLFESENCTLQVAGSDQWGNITAGVDLIRKKTGKEAYAFTMPLVTTKDGIKMSKSEGKTLWLDKNKTSPYTLYQYFLNADDEMVVSYLKRFTFLNKDEINELAKETKQNPHLRLAQKALAKEIIVFLHGKEEYQKAINLTEILFKEEFSKLKKEEVKDIFNNERINKLEIGTNILDLLINSQIASSKREAREFVTGNAIAINGNKIKAIDLVINKDMLIDNTYLIVKKGKKNYFIFEK